MKAPRKIDERHAKGGQVQAVVRWRRCQNCDGSGKTLDPEAIGANMQQLRNAASVTRKEISKLMNLSIGYVSDLEHGRKAWNGIRIVQYITALETAKELKQ